MATILNIGLIGYKFMGRAHSNAYRQVDKFFKLRARPVLKVICGRDEKKAKEAACRLGWEEYSTDWREVINRPDIDIVDISTPNNFHAEIAIAAARAGKAILCEKPLAMNVKECRQMLGAARKAGVTHMVCHNYRRIPAIALAKKMIEEGELGKIYHYRARYLQDWIADPKFPLVWRLQNRMAGSGTHGDIHTHIIDLARYLVGEIDKVSGLLHTFIKKRPLESGSGKTRGTGRTAGSVKIQELTPGAGMGRVTVDDAAMCLARFKNGAIGNLEASRFALGRKNCIQIEINGSKGSLAFDFEEMNRLKFFNNADPQHLRGFRDILVTEGVHPYVGSWWPPGHIIGYEHTFVHTIADFLNAVAQGGQVSPDFEDGLRNQEILAAVEKSAKSGKWESVR